VIVPSEGIAVDGEVLDIGHTWLRGAAPDSESAGVESGQRVRCLARVRPYKKPGEWGECYGVGYPTAIEVLSHSVALRPSTRPGPKPAVAGWPDPKPPEATAQDAAGLGGS
jgi:hypothetical protein